MNDAGRGNGSLDRQVAVVTGASSGMGREIAVAMAAAGARVALVGRSEERLAETAGEIAAAAGESLSVPVDLTGDRAAEEVVEAVTAGFGGIDCMVHGAGIFEVGPVDESLEMLDRQWLTNVRAPYRLTVAALPALRHSRGNVIFFSSIAGKVGFPAAAAYCVTKGAVELATKSLAVEEAPNGVRVNAIAPGNVETPMNAHLMAEPAYLEAMLAATPLGRNGRPADIVPLVLLLASGEGSWITGQSFVVDGGWVAQ